MDHAPLPQLEELLKASKKANKEDKELADLLSMLLKSKAWEAYEKLLASRIQSYSDYVLRPAASVDRAMALEYVKGAMSGLIMAQQLPSVIVEAMKPSTGDDGEG